MYIYNIVFGIYFFRDIEKIIWIFIADSYIVDCRDRQGRRTGREGGGERERDGLETRCKREDHANVYASPCPISDTLILSTPMSRFLSCCAS